jgi:NADPH:quinone reductase-like Zn-dependent oxidoreductase
MRVFEIRDGFGLENLKQVERPDPKPGRGQVLLEMRAASLNFRDLMTVEGLYNPKQPLPLIPCSDGVGVDHVVEIGGAGTLQQSLWAVRFGGEISVIGVLAGATSDLNILPILMQAVRLRGVVVGSRDGFARMNRAIASRGLPPVVDRVFGFGETPEAFAYMKRGAHFGKLCIEFG